LKPYFCIRSIFYGEEDFEYTVTPADATEDTILKVKEKIKKV